MNRVAILGSGFGLYGYLPALASLGQQIILPERYQARFFARPELDLFTPQIEWVADETGAIHAASAVVLALPPEQQAYWLSLCLNQKNITHLCLEKPLAKTPAEAMMLLSQLQNAGKKYRIGYLFRYTGWGNALITQFNQPLASTALSINWHFMAHHYQHAVATWKRAHSAGGSVLRFYGIHLLALLAELGYDRVTSSTLLGQTEDEYDSWCAHFTGPALPTCQVHVDTRAKKPLFEIKQSSESHFIPSTTLTDPFSETNEQSTNDRRVILLRELCNSFFANVDNTPDYYRSTLALWQQTENHLINEEILL